MRATGGLRRGAGGLGPARPAPRQEARGSLPLSARGGAGAWSRSGACGVAGASSPGGARGSGAPLPPPGLGGEPGWSGGAVNGEAGPGL